MNELQKTNGGTVAMQPATQTGFNFFDPVQFDTMQRVCQMFASSDLVPDTYRAVIKPIPAGASEAVMQAVQAENAAARSKAVANCMIAVEVSTRIGASPLMVMQNMAVIYGRPSWSSKFLIATVNSCGRFEPLQFKFTDKGHWAWLITPIMCTTQASVARKPSINSLMGERFVMLNVWHSLQRKVRTAYWNPPPFPFALPYKRVGTPRMAASGRQ